MYDYWIKKEKMISKIIKYFFYLNYLFWYIIYSYYKRSQWKENNLIEERSKWERKWNIHDKKISMN